MRIKSILCAMSLVGYASTAYALPSLRTNERIETGLFNIAVADEIRNNCPSIKGRVLKAIGQLNALERHALGLGYSKDEVRAYVRSDAERARMDRRRKAYLAAAGVVESDPQSYCRAGRAEIEQASGIGRLLR